MDKIERLYHKGWWLGAGTMWLLTTVDYILYEAEVPVWARLLVGIVIVAPGLFLREYIYKKAMRGKRNDTNLREV